MLLDKNSYRKRSEVDKDNNTIDDLFV